MNEDDERSGRKAANSSRREYKTNKPSTMNERGNTTTWMY
jgi:hypothetical protein